MTAIIQYHRNDSNTFRPELIRGYTPVASKYGEYGNAGEKHRVVTEALKDKNYPRLMHELIRDLINHSNAEGVTHIGQKKLGELISRSVDTVQSYLKKLVEDGVITKQKNGWQQTLTVTLLPIQHWNMNKDRKTRHNLINLKSYPRDLNTIHYDEYVSSKANPEKKPIASTPQTNNRLMKSEWEAKNETLDEPLQEIIVRDFAPEHREQASLTLRRLSVPLEVKKRVLQEAAPIAKQTTIRNIGGFLVSTFKKMRDKMNHNYTQTTVRAAPRDYEQETRLLETAQTLATEQLKAQGIIDPMLCGIVGYDVEIDRLRQEYNSRHSSLYVKILQELRKPIQQRLA